MTAQWSAEQVLALSPDAGSTQRGKALATAAKWPVLAMCDDATTSVHVIWGECQGSGKKPYRTVIDLGIDLGSADGEPAFRCSCPSRKFPCKHSLGLFLLLTKQASFVRSSPPDWVSDWLNKREQKASDKAVAAKPSDSSSDSVASQQQTQARPEKRLEKRLAKVTEGLIDLDQWLQDLVRRGLADLESQPYSFWDQAAARLVDAQAPGLASRVRELAGIFYAGTDWPERLLPALGSLHLLVRAYQQRSYLSPEMQAEILKQIGFTQKKEDLVQQSEQPNSGVVAVTDVWQVMGKVITEEDALKSQRVWLGGTNSKKVALVLSFAHGRRQQLDVSLVPGRCFEGRLIFYPGAGQGKTGVRAFVAERARALEAVRTGLGDSCIEDAITRYAQVLTQNPWQLQFPLTLAQVLFRYQAGQWWLQDKSKQALPVSSAFLQGWEILAMSGGRPLTVFGEWDGRSLLPLSVWSEQKFMAVGD